MQTLRKFVPFILALILAGCTTLGGAPADTFNKQVVVANGLAESAANTIAILRQSDRLSQVDAQDALDTVADAAAGIDAARALWPGDRSEAATQLDAIVTSLNALNAYLSAKQ